MAYIIYCLDSEEANYKDIDLKGDYSIKLWTPSMVNMKPEGLSKECLQWWILYLPKILSGRFGFSAFLGYFNKKLVHFSFILTKCFKFPFMGEDDIHIGPV